MLRDNLVSLLGLAILVNTGFLNSTEHPWVKVGGFVACQFIYDQTPNLDVNNSFKFRHARLHGIGTLSEKLNGFVQIENRTGKTSLQNAYINFLPFPEIEVRAGYIKLPFGIEAFGHPLKNPTIDVSMASKSIYRGAHDMGIHLQYKQKLLTGWVAILNGNNGSVLDNNDAKDLGGKLILRPITEFDLGGSFYVGKTDTNELTTHRVGAETNYRNGPFWLRGEWLYAVDESALGGEIQSMGYYAVATYRFLDQFEAVARYDSFDPDIETGNNEWENITLGLSYYLIPKGWNRFSINYETRDYEIGNDDLLTLQLQVLF